MIRVYIDNNIWDFLYKNNINLKSHFDPSKYSLRISKHGLYEIQQMPDNENTASLKEFIHSALSEYVDVVSRFGFFDPSVPENEQRSSGFGVGGFSSVKENKERERLRAEFGTKEKRKESMILFKQEADIELGALSQLCFVITLDKKNGPLKSASENGGNVIFLNEISDRLDESSIRQAVLMIEAKI